MSYLRNNINPLLILLSIIFAVGCNTSGPEIDSPMSAKVNGDTWIADDTAYQRSITLNGNAKTIIYGISSTNGRIALYTKKPITSSGVYEIELSESDALSSYYWPKGDDMNDIYYAVSGKVIVEQYANGEITGSFEMAGDNDSNSTVEILNGRLDNLTGDIE